MDIVFLFWSIAAGIVLAAGLLPLAVLGSLLIGIVLVVFAGRKAGDSPYMLMIVCENRETEDKIKAMLSATVRRMAVKSKSVSANGIELNFEVRLKAGETDFVNLLCETPGVVSAVLVSYNGDYMG